MIHLNLIDAAERLTIVESVSPVHVTSIDELKKKSRKKALTVAVAALFAIVAFSAFLSICGVPAPLQGIFPEAYLSLIGAEDASRTALVMGNGQRTSAGGSLEAQAAAQAAALRYRDNMTAKQVVGEINPQALFNNKRTDYNSYLPLEKVSFQKSSLGQFVAFMNSATPEDVGFSDCIYQAPNYFYVRGVAAKPASQRSFLDRIKTVSSNFRTPPLPENAPATDITAFGQYNVENVNLNSVNKFVSAAEVANEVKAIKTLGSTNKVTFNGFEKPVVEDFGVYKRFTYQVTTSADFSDLQAFVAAFSASPIRMGVPSVEMKFARKDLLTAIRFEMFVIP
ncbi:hypothetical protein [Fibrobacter sp. HC4]|uniref:hypothetical protein n=1 Tax=Fibrobacter sp. HC4 TaxID=3239812 RepID=UPI002018FAFC|nr:hypothetical protein [Fibrobacter succinogenes]MCL4100718.1 hypothetical protein [Fibrobacter succinogenes]MCQ2100395.1 hypothetical protein [Fibrobacter sp.]MDO4946914.1 hypothetical protein [Fibrobacter sp.]